MGYLLPHLKPTSDLILFVSLLNIIPSEIPLPRKFWVHPLDVLQQTVCILVKQLYF